MIKLYRDGYNKTNMDIDLRKFHLHFFVVSEPWDGPHANIHISWPGKFFGFSFSWIT